MFFKLLNKITKRPIECNKFKYKLFPRTEYCAKYAAPFWATGWFRWRTWRCPQAGIDHLKWASSLVIDDSFGAKPNSKNYGKPTNQAVIAKEMLELYTWWKEIYPKRQDPHVASGWTELCDKRREAHKDDIMFNDRTPDEKKETRKVLDAAYKIEKQYDKEETEMMCRLIRIRDGLWT